MGVTTAISEDGSTRQKTEDKINIQQISQIQCCEVTK